MGHARHPSRVAPLLALALCLGASPGMAEPLYSLETTIPIPPSADNNVGGKFSVYDIGYFDGATQDFYLADRSNASVDIFSAANNTFVGRIGGTGHLFVGIQPPPPATANNDISGPDGIVTANLPGQHELFAGDGNSTLKVFNLATPAAPPVTISTGDPVMDKRVDEMSFSPQTQRLLAANNAAATPFATLVDTTNNSITHKIVFDGSNSTPHATVGIEQSVWDPSTKNFYLSIPEIDGGGPGGIAVIDPLSGAVLHTFDLASFGISACSPSGLAIGQNSRLFIGCATAGSQTILFDPTGKGGVVKTFPQISGEDEVWFDPTTNRFFAAARFHPGGPVLGVVDGATGTFIEDVATTTNDHTVAVDPVSGEVFVPYGAGNPVCPNGCIAVFGTKVPEPSSLLLFVPALAVIAGGAARRRSRRA